ncbi:MAG: serine/threonine protein kinase [Colwellia sp.]|nr:serine/threonine protein kinase [Colwellia sp.]
MKNKDDVDDWISHFSNDILDKVYENYSQHDIEDYIGLEIPPYRIESLLNIGGFSAVFLAKRIDKLITRHVAIKVILPEFIGMLNQINIKEELGKLSILNHGNIAHTYDAGYLPDGEIYIAMEYIPGSNIVKHVNDNQLSIKKINNLFLQIARAVQYAHERGITHNDIKPSNILMQDENQIKLLDFGISKQLNTEDENSLLTSIYGSAYSAPYASPEQVNNSKLTERSDVYSLGMLLATLFTKKTLPADINKKKLLQTLEKKLPNDLIEIIKKCLQFNSDDRYTSVIALSDDIYRFQQNLPILAKPYSLPYALKKFAQRFPIFSGSAIVATITVSVLALSLYSSLHKVTYEKETALAFSSIMQNIIALADPSTEQSFKVTGDNLLTSVIREVDNNKKLNEPAKLVLKSQLLMSLIHNNRYENTQPIVEYIVPEFKRRFEQLTKGEKQFIAVTLAYYFNHLGEQQKLDLYIDIAVRNKTADYPATDPSYVNAMIVYSLSNKSKNKELIDFTQNIIINDSRFPKEYLADIQYLMATSYRELGMTDFSIKYIKKAIETIKGQSNPQKKLSYYYSGLGRTLVDAEQYKEAEAYFIKAIDLSKSVDGENSEIYMVNVNDMASLYLNTEQYDKAIENYTIVYNWITKNFGKENINSATLAFNLCLCYEELENTKKTLKYCNEAEGTFNRIQPDHQYRVRSLLVSAETYINIGRLNDAEQLFTQLELLKDLTPEKIKNQYTRLITLLAKKRKISI